MKPYYEDEWVTLYKGDCREITAWLEADVLVTDPPYPNNAGHFDDAVPTARWIVEAWQREAIIFWNECEFSRSSVWSAGHPTQKPTGVMESLIGVTGGDVIADPFAGSGSTLVAAKAMGRRAIGVEVNEQFAEIAAIRLAQDTLFAA